MGEMLRFLCWEGLELLVLGEGRWQRALGPSLSSYICTLEELVLSPVRGASPGQ